MTLHVLRTGPLVTLQDRGRPGVAHLGVPHAGALDPPAAGLANRLVGNDDTAAVLEVVLGGLELRAERGCWVAVTGAPAPLSVGGRTRAHAHAERVPPGATLRLGSPPTGVRSYLAVAGGFDVPAVLGSRSTDTLAWVGPPRVVAGTTLPVGRPHRGPRPHDTPRLPEPGPLRITPGPRDDWFTDDAIETLCGSSYAVGADSNRVGLRLDGPPVRRRRPGEELPSEGMVLGGVQVPPDGRPVVLLADHPPTGGYPVVAVVHAEDLWLCAQLRPGEEVRFSLPGRGPAGATA